MAQQNKNTDSVMEKLDLSLERDLFMRTLIRELSNVLENVVGIDEASGYISVVGQNMGEQINQDYCRALSVEKLSAEQVARVLIDLKQRIQGDFYLIEETPQKLILGSRSCPFAEKVIGQEAMCMMTSNVFGCIAAQNLGYARVVLDKTIARGDKECRIIVYLNPAEKSDDERGREYFQKESHATR